MEATDSQRAYLMVLCNKAFAAGKDLGRWAGLDYRAAIRSQYLTKVGASSWIAFLIGAIKK